MIPHIRRGLSRSAAFALILALVLALSVPTAAHILDERSQFPDIAASPHAGDIMALVALNVIPQTPVFEPSISLAREALAAWAALAHGLGAGGEESSNVDALAKVALSESLLPSLEGEATYSDINAAMFDGRLELGEGEAGKTPTKAEAAAFIAEHLETDLGGETLLSRLGALAGPTGTVESLTSEGEGHHSRVSFTIGEETLPVDAHGRVAFGPTDLTQWEGLAVTRSFVATGGDHPVLVYVESDGSVVGPSSDGHSHGHDHAAAHEHGTATGHSHEPIEIPVEAGVAVPTVELTVEPDAMSGWNIHVATTHFTWTPENVNGPVYMNEGHAHLYVDGEKVTRLYGPWYALSMDLSPGTHTIEVGLNANNHAPFAHDGEAITGTATITVEE